MGETRKHKKEIQIPDSLKQKIKGCEFAILVGSTVDKGISKDRDIDIRAYFKDTKTKHVEKDNYHLFFMSLDYALNDPSSFYEEYHNMKTGTTLFGRDNYKKWMEKFEKQYWDEEKFKEIVKWIQGKDWMSFNVYASAYSILKEEGTYPPKEKLKPLLEDKPEIKQYIEKAELPPFPDKEQLMEEFRRKG